MTSVPLNQTPRAHNMPQEGNRTGTISLAQMIDFIIQKTYNDLIVLSDTIGSQTDMERKVSLYKFSERTRQLFIKLLALVKWSSNISKVNKAASAINFLDQQSALFMDTADQLSRLSRETLVNARLPTFNIPAAVEVLTTGSFNRLPTCIKDRIVPSKPITLAEEKSTLQTLNQVIQHRLVTGNLLPQMNDIKIREGRVTIRVNKEFSMCLTVMGDGPDIPWRLLDIEFLVSDRETGSGSSLVHPLQTRYMHQLVQSRLLETPNSLSDAYYTLHNFSQSLQLEVLYSQTLRLVQDRLINDIQVDQYKPGDRLTVSYWKELTLKDPKSRLGYKLTVHINHEDPAESLTVINMPSLGSKDSEITKRLSNAEQLSMEYLLVDTINIRTVMRLSELRQDIENMGIECTLSGFPKILSAAVLKPCLPSEYLRITIDTYTGMFQCFVSQYEVPFISELSAALNGNRSQLPALITDLKYWITQRRCEKTLEFLPVTVYDNFPIIFEPDHPFANKSKRQMIVRFDKYPSAILIVEFKEKESCEIGYDCYLANIKPCPMNENSDIDLNNSTDNDNAKVHLYYRIHQELTELNTFIITHGPFTSIDADSSEKKNKRSSSGSSDHNETSLMKKLKPSPYIIPELAHIVAACDERIPFTALVEELTKRNILNQGIQINSSANGLVLKIIQLPSPSSDSKVTTAWKSLSKRLLSISIHRKYENNMTFEAEFEFYGTPLTTNAPLEQSTRRPVYFSYDFKTIEEISDLVDSLLGDWAKLVYLYSIAQNLSDYLNTEKCNLKNIVKVISYCYTKLILYYGPSYQYTVEITWTKENKSYKLVFLKSLTTVSINGHSLIKEPLEAHLNRHHNLVQVIQILHETLEPCISINKLPTIPQMGIFHNRTTTPVQIFTIIPQYPTMVRISYQQTFCLEVKFRGNGLVTVRDSTYSKFDTSKLVGEFIAIPGLKTFLSKYEDQTMTLFKQLSLTEDDNPPSPVSMDTGVGFMSSQNRNGSQSPAKRDGLRFNHAPSTPPSFGNPLTPASQNFVNSPAPSYSLTSPPSLAPSTPNMMAHPSPGFVANSPMHAPSPAGHMDSSPFPSQSMASPASNWPVSPGMPRPSPIRAGQSPSYAPVPSPSSVEYKTSNSQQVSRVLPQRSWAGAVPTFLTHRALDRLCTPSTHPSGFPSSFLSPLERFLGCVFMKRQIQRLVITDEAFIAFSGTEPGAVYFKVETLQCRVALNSQHMQSLHLRVQPISDHKDKWMTEETQILEAFFDNKASSTPFKSNTLLAFCKILTVPLNALKDFIKIMKLELNPGVHQHQLKWSVQWCLRIHPSSTLGSFPMGITAILHKSNKILFFLQITKIENSQEPPSFILPLLYDCSTNTTILFQKQGVELLYPQIAVSLHLKRFAEATKLQDCCSIFPAISNLLMNFVLPDKPVTQQAPAIKNPTLVRHTQQNPPAIRGQLRNGGPVRPQGPCTLQNMPMRAQQ